MDIRDSDLQYLPFKMGKWLCVVKDCKGYTGIKDYDLTPYYWNNVKRSRTSIGWRGGWFSVVNHFFICSRHVIEYRELGWRMFKNKYLPDGIDAEYKKSRIEISDKKQKTKHEKKSWF